MTEHDRPVLLQVVEGSLEANLYRSLLEAQGIPVMLRQEPAGTVLGINVGPLSEVEIYVPSSHLESAREIVDAYRSARNQAEDESP